MLIVYDKQYSAYILNGMELCLYQQKKKKICINKGWNDLSRAHDSYLNSTFRSMVAVDSAYHMNNVVVNILSSYTSHPI